MQIKNNNNPTALRLTFITLILIICSSLSIIILLIIDKRDGLVHQVDSVLSFDSSCSIYIGQKYQLLFYNLKLRFISIGVVVAGLVSVGLVVGLVMVRRKEMFAVKGENRQDLLPETNRSTARQSLLNKTTLNHSLQQQAKSNKNNITPAYPFNPLFFLLFSIIIIALIVPLGLHLSFFIEWTFCGRYDISEIKIIVFIMLQGISVILAFIAYCLNLNRRIITYQQGDGASKSKQQKHLQAQLPSLRPKQQKKQQYEHNKGNEMSKVNANDQKNIKKQNPQHQIVKDTPINNQQKINENTITEYNNKLKKQEITNNTTKLPLQQKKTPKYQQSNSTQLKYQKPNISKQPIKKPLSLLQQIKQVQSNCETVNQNCQVHEVVAETTINNGKGQTIQSFAGQNAINKQSQMLKSQKNELTQTVTKFNNASVVNNHQNVMNNGDNQKINSSSVIQKVNQIAIKKPQTTNTSYAPPTLQSPSINNFTKSDQNYIVEKAFSNYQFNQKTSHNQLLTQQAIRAIKIEPKQNEIEMTPLQNNSQSQKFAKKIPQISQAIKIPIQQPSLIHKLPAHSQQTITQTIFKPQPSQIIFPIPKKKQLKFCSSVYSIEQSSPFSAFTTNVITSRISYSNQVVQKTQKDVSRRQFQQLLQQEDDDQRYMTNRGRDLSGFGDESYSGYNVSRQERFSPSNKKATMQQQYLPQKRYFRKPPQRRRNQQERQIYYEYPQYNQPTFSNKQNRSQQQKVTIPPLKLPNHRLIPQKQQVYNKRYNPDESQLINADSGDDSFRSGSSYYHNSIRKEINASGNRLWDNGNDKSQKRGNSTMQQIMLSDINSHSIVHDVSTPKSSIKKHSVNLIVVDNNRQQLETKFQKKQKKLKKHIQQRISKLNEQQSQLDKKVIQESLKYLNHNNYNSVLNPVIEENKQLQIQQQQQQQLFQQKLLQAQLLNKQLQAQKQQQVSKQKQSKLIDEHNQQKPYPPHPKSNRTLVKTLQNSARQDQSSVKLREKRQKSKKQLLSQQKQSQELQMNKFNNIFVKYNDLYEYKKKVLKKRRNSDANINLQNYQPVIVKPVESPKKNINTLHPSLPKRKYLDPSQFTAEIVLLTPQAIRDRRLSK